MNQGCLQSIETQTAKQRSFEERSDLVLQVISTYSPSGQESEVAKIIFDYLKREK